MDEIKVSVTVLAYKHAKYIRKALDTILSQKVNFKYEIIVGDDHSEDGTKEILEEYAERYPDIIRPVINEENLGAARNSYRIKQLCRGQYVANTEGDDYWLNDNKLQMQVDYLDQHPEISGVAHNYVNVNADGSNPLIAMFGKQLGRNYCLKDYLDNGYTWHGNTLLYRNIIPTSGEKYEKLRFAAPTMGDITVRCLLYDKGDIYVMPEVMLAHRSPENIKSSFSFQEKSKAVYYSWMQMDIVKALNEYFEGKYNFNPIIENRAAFLLVEKRRHKIVIDQNEFDEYFNSLSPEIRRAARKKAIKRFWGMVKRKLNRMVHKYS